MKPSIHHLTILIIAVFISANSFAQGTKSLTNQADYARQFVKSGYRQPDSLPKAIGWVNDYEAIFSLKQRLFLDSIIRSYKAATGTEIAIVTLDSTYTNNANFDDYTLRLARKWGIGEKGKDNGILIGASKRLRKIRIQNGKGIEKIITDEETKNIIDRYMIPNFKKGNYYEGTLIGLMEMIKLLRIKSR